MSELSPARRLTILMMMTVVAGLLSGIWWMKKSPPPQPISITGTVLQPARPLGAFHLTDHKLQDFDQRQLQGKWSFMFFGYTNCPDICPTTLFLFKMLAAKLLTQSDLYKSTQFLFVSVDPERDTAEVLARYMDYYNPDFKGLTGTAEEIKQFTTMLGVPYIIGEHEPGQKNYTVDHTGVIILVNPQGGFQAVFSPPQKLDEVYTDYLKLVNYYQ